MVFLFLVLGSLFLVDEHSGGFRRAGQAGEWGQENGLLILLPPFFCLFLGLHPFDVGSWKVGLLGYGFANLSQRDLLDGRRVFLDGQRDFELGAPHFESPSQAPFSGSAGPFCPSEAPFSGLDRLKGGSRILSKYLQGGKRSVRGTF